MAKVEGSKSAAIRDYLAKNPSAKPKEIYEALSKQGIKLSLALVNAIKYSKPKAGKRSGEPKRKDVPVSHSGMSAADLIATKQMVDSLGGIGQAKDVLDLLERLK